MTENLAGKLLKYPTAIGRIFIVIINNVYCIPTYVIWMGLLMPLKRLNPDAYYKIEGLLFHWLLAIVSMWSYTAGYDIVEVGDDIEECRSKKTLVIANHQSTADVPLLMANFSAKESVLPNIMWIMDRLFKYTNFGIVSIIHQDFFIASGRNKRDESIETLKSHLKNSYIKRNRKWMVLFPEGGFLRKRKEVSQRYSKKNNLPLLDYVTLPRVGALKAIMDVMCNEATKIESPIQTNSDSIEDNNTSINQINKNITNCNNSTINTKNSKNLNIDEKNKMQVNLTKSVPNNDDVNTDNTITNSLHTKNLSTNTTTADNLANGDSVLDTTKTNTLNSSTLSSNNNKNSTECLLEYILDITIAYPNGKPLDLPNIIHGLRLPCQTYMLYRLYKVSNVPKDSEALTKWLYDRFVEKNQLLERFYKTGQFYLDRTMNNGQVIQQDILRFVLINLFFITSTYFHYQMFTSLYAYGIYLTYGAS